MRRSLRRFCVERLEPRAMMAVSPVLDLNTSPAQGSAPDAAAYGGAFYFTTFDAATGSELWKSDGTPGGTSLLRDILPGPRNASPTSLAVVNGVLLFSADDGAAGRELWKTDGTADGTVRVADLTPGPAGSIISPMVSAGGAAYYFVHGIAVDTLWKTDGSADGTVKLRDFDWPRNPGEVAPEGAMAGDRFVFRAADEATGEEVWVTDGTPDGTVLLKDIWSHRGGSTPRGFTSVGGRVVFEAAPGVRSLTSTVPTAVPSFFHSSNP